MAMNSFQFSFLDQKVMIFVPNRQIVPKPNNVKLRSDLIDLGQKGHFMDEEIRLR